MGPSLSKLSAHLVFSTKHREPLLLRPPRGRVHAYLATVLKNLDSPARKIGGVSDHVHVLFRTSKNHALADVVEAVKTSSSRWIKAQSPALRSFNWQSGYGSFSLSHSEVEAVAEYIDRQEEHHRTVSFQSANRQSRRFSGHKGTDAATWTRQPSTRGSEQVAQRGIAATRDQVFIADC